MYAHLQGFFSHGVLARPNAANYLFFIRSFIVLNIFYVFIICLTCVYVYICKDVFKYPMKMK